MNQNHFFQIAEFIKNWCELNDQQITITEIEVEHEKALCIWFKSNSIEYQGNFDSTGGSVKIKKVERHYYTNQSGETRSLIF